MQKSEQENLEEKLAKRDQYMSMVLDALERNQVNDEEGRKKLIEEYKHMMDLVFDVDTTRSFGNFQKNRLITEGYKGITKIFKERRMKEFFLVFLTGVLLTVIPSVVYIKSINTNPYGKYEFIPNAMGEKKPMKMMTIKNQEDLDLVKRSSIDNKQYAKIGLHVGYSSVSGLYLESNTQGAHYKDIPLEITGVKDGDFKLVYDVVKTRDAIPMDIVKTEVQLQRALTIQNFQSKKELALGSAIMQADNGGYFAINKDYIEHNYIMHQLDQGYPV